MEALLAVGGGVVSIAIILAIYGLLFAIAFVLISLAVSRGIKRAFEDVGITRNGVIRPVPVRVVLEPEASHDLGDLPL